MGKSKIPLDLPPSTAESGLLADGIRIGANVHGAFSSAYEWGSETTQALKELVPEYCNQVFPTVNNLGAAFASVTPQLQLPVAASVAGLRTAIEANVGKAIGDILPDDPGIDFKRVAGMVANIAGAAITYGVNSIEFAKAISDIALDVMDAIPVLGGLVRAVVGAMWAGINQADAEAQRAARMEAIQSPETALDVLDKELSGTLAQDKATPDGLAWAFAMAFDNHAEANPAGSVYLHEMRLEDYPTEPAYFSAAHRKGGGPTAADARRYVMDR